MSRKGLSEVAPVPFERLPELSDRELAEHVIGYVWSETGYRTYSEAVCNEVVRRLKEEKTDG